MCLIAFAIGASPRWPLVIASNRDEFLSRPTLPLARWQTQSGQEIISGRDLRAGGTWLGMTPGGRVAFLTNVREAAPRIMPSSRGELVTRWLDARGDTVSFAALLEKDQSAYAGFNLVIGDFQRNDWAWLTNKSAASMTGWHAQALQTGIYGLSNAALDTPWPKTMELKRVLTEALGGRASASNADSLQVPLWAALVNRKRASVDSLPSTGVTLAAEEALSSAFVDFPELAYGTRASTLLLARKEDLGESLNPWRFQVEERSHRRERSGQDEAAGTSSRASFVLDFPGC